MAKRRKRGSWWAERWTKIITPIRHARYRFKRIVKKPLSYLKEKLTCRNEYGMIRPYEPIFRMYELNNRINGMSRRRQIIIRSLLGMLAVVCMCIAFYAIYYCAILDSPRRAIDTLIGTFEYPSLPQRSRKVFFFFKISFGICFVYNMLSYLVYMHTETLSLMDYLEKTARTIIPGQWPDARLDSTVPVVGDGCKTQRARHLIAMRRLFRRGEFTFDVMPELMPVKVFNPTDEEWELLTEAAEEMALKRIKDPKMIREFIRKRESQEGRRRAHLNNLKQQRRKVSLSDTAMARALNVVDEDDSESLSSISLKWSNESLISNESMKSHSSKEDPTASTSEISSRMSKEAPMKGDGDPFTSQKEDVSKTSPTIRARKIPNRIPGMPRPRTPTPLRGSAGPTNVNPTSGARATAVGAAKAPAGVVAAGTKRNGPLQATKWPISGTCRPVRSRPPSPVITPTVLKPPGVSSRGDFSSASKQRRTPSAGPVPKALTVAATAVESKKRYSRSAVRRVPPSSPATVTTPPRSRATPPPPCTPVSSPTRRPNSAVRRHTLPPPRIASPVVLPPTPQHTSSPTSSFSIPRPATRQRPQPPFLPTPSPQGKTLQSATTPTSTPAPQRIPLPGSPATPPSKPSPTSVMHMSMDMVVMANGGGEAPCLPAIISPATSFVNTPAIHQEPTTSSPVRQKPPSAPTSPPQQPQRTVVAERNRSRPPFQRRRTSTGDDGFPAATAGPRQSVAENAYKKLRENFASAKPPMQNQGPVMNRDRRPPSRTPVKPNIKSAEGTRVWHY